MKSLIKILGLLFFFSQFSFSQNSRTIIPLSPAIGDTLDVNEKEYYHLYSHYSGFQHMVIYTNVDSTFTLKITYLDTNDNLRDTILVKDMTFIESLKIQINKVDEGINYEAEKSGTDNYQRIIVTTRIDSSYAAYIYAIKDTGIFIYPEEKLLLKNSSEQIDAIFIPLKELKNITLDNSEKASQNFLYGIIGLATLGAIIGFASGDDPPGEFLSFTAGQKALYGGLIGTIVGTILGLFVILNDEEIIEIYSYKDLEKLKEYLIM